MVRTSLFTQELAHELTGSPLQVHSLKQELRKRLATLQEAPEIVRWHGQETVIRLPKGNA